MSGNRRKRLEKLEEKLSDLIRQEELANCICLKLLFAYSREMFLSEMNKTCPVHGLRRLRKIVLVRKGPKDESFPGLKEVVNEYRRRLAEVEEAEEEKEHGCEEH
jgi:hypothetical protein